MLEKAVYIFRRKREAEVISESGLGNKTSMAFQIQGQSSVTVSLGVLTSFQSDPCDLKLFHQSQPDTCSLTHPVIQHSSERATQLSLIGKKTRWSGLLG